MAMCINKNSVEYQSLKDRAGIPEFILEAISRDFLEKYGRLPYLDELPNSNSEPYLRDLLGITKHNSAKIESILEMTGKDTVEEAVVDINNQFRDLETTIVPINKEALVDIVHRPTENNFDNWTEEDEILAQAPRDNNGNLLAPNGKISNLTELQYVLVRTKAFKRWFGDWENNPSEASKIVDENGEPLVVYHGGEVNINSFKNSSLITSNTGSGFYTDHITGEKIPTDSNRTIFFSDREGVGISYAVISSINKFKRLKSDVFIILDTIDGHTKKFNQRFKKFDEFIDVLNNLSLFNSRFTKLINYLIENKKSNKNLNDKEKAAFKEMLVEANKEVDKLNNKWNYAKGDWYDQYHEAKRILDIYDSKNGIERLLNGEIPSFLKREYEQNLRLLYYRKLHNLGGDSGLEESSVVFNAEGLNTYVAMYYDGSTLKIDMNGKEYIVTELSYKELQNILSKLRNYNNSAVASYSRKNVLGKHSELYEVFLNIKNPLVHDYEGTLQGSGYKMSLKYPFGYIAARLVNKAINDGNDGVIYLNLMDPYLANNYGVFKPNQIKSATSNSGSFNRFSRNIYDPEPNGYLVLNNALQKLASLYGITFNEISDAELNSEKWQGVIPDGSLVNAFIHNGQIYINLDRANLDAPIHEMFHMFVGSLRFTNPSLYQSLIESVQSLSNYDRLVQEYPGRTRNDVNEEIFVTEISRYLTGQLSSLAKMDSKTRYEISYNIKRMLDTILMGLDSVKTISEDRLFNLSLKEIAQEVNSAVMVNNFTGTMNVEGSELHRRLNNVKSDLYREGTLEEYCD